MLKQEILPRNVLEDREVVSLVFTNVQLPTCPSATAGPEFHLGIREKLEHVRSVQFFDGGNRGNEATNSSHCPRSHKS